MSPDSKTSPQSPREFAPNTAKGPGKAYTPPRLRSLGRVNAITLTTSQHDGLSRRKPQG
jgi:hypothetical protein